MINFCVYYNRIHGKRVLFVTYSDGVQSSSCSLNDSLLMIPAAKSRIWPDRSERPNDNWKTVP